jgi:hypothetical protein
MRFSAVCIMRELMLSQFNDLARSLLAYIL